MRNGRIPGWKHRVQIPKYSWNPPSSLLSNPSVLFLKQQWYMTTELHTNTHTHTHTHTHIQKKTHVDSLTCKCMSTQTWAFSCHLAAFPANNLTPHASSFPPAAAAEWQPACVLVGSRSLWARRPPELYLYSERNSGGGADKAGALKACTCAQIGTQTRLRHARSWQHNGINSPWPCWLEL